MSATILGYPLGRHASVPKLARQFRGISSAELPEFLRRQTEHVAAKRIQRGVPPALAVEQALEFEAAILRRIKLLQTYGATG